MAPQLTWTDDMINTLLLELVILKGIHIAVKKEVKGKWKELDEDLFKNAPFSHYKLTH